MSDRQEKNREREAGMRQRRIGNRFRRKLVGLFLTVILALVGLAARITWINAREGDQYRRIVMSQAQQQYDSRTIPARRGDILDRNGTILATSEKVYNLILDCKVVNDVSKTADGEEVQKYVEPTVRALVRQMGLSEMEIRRRLTSESTRDSQYQVLLRNLSEEKKKEFEDYLHPDRETAAELTEEELTLRANVRGVWFEESYRRVYPQNSLACDLIGFSTDNVSASYGIEGYYSSVLNGTSGRQYGYFNTDADVEQTVIPAADGLTVVSTIDVNIQQIIRSALEEYESEMSDADHAGAADIGVIVMDPNTGEILGMDSSDWYNLNNPRDLTPFYSADDIASMDDRTKANLLSRIWRNYCVSETFEPGSTFKPVTAAAALDAAAVTTDEVFVCDGIEVIYDQKIKCDVYPRMHLDQTLRDALKNSCNDAFMQIAALLGEDSFLAYQKAFGFGTRTGIDLPGESSGILFSADSMGPVELATSAFGQGFTCNMVQEAAAFSAVINGGYYYRPHVVKEIRTASGTTTETVSPVMERQVVSTAVSSIIREDLQDVTGPEGTGRIAKVKGYSMGGKTGTAEKLPRGNGKYLVSFLGFAPLDNPQLVVYVVVDEPNANDPASSRYANAIARNIFNELLPYMNIFPDENGYENAAGEGGDALAGMGDEFRMDESTEIPEEEYVEGETPGENTAAEQGAGGLEFGNDEEESIASKNSDLPVPPPGTAEQTDAPGGNDMFSEGITNEDIDRF